MDDKPSKIAKAMEISQRTLRIVRQNIVFALAVKLLVLALTAVRHRQHVGGGLRRRGRHGYRYFKCFPGLASREEII